MTQCASMWRTSAILILFVSLLMLPRTAAQTAPFDIVITHGRIIDGTRSPWHSGDIGIHGGRIAAIGSLTRPPPTRTIDAHGPVVAPGFIDMLRPSELTNLVAPRLPSKI